MTIREYLEVLNDGLGTMEAEDRADVILEMESHIEELKTKFPGLPEDELVAKLTPADIVASGICEGAGIDSSRPGRGGGAGSAGSTGSAGTAGRRKDNVFGSIFDGFNLKNVFQSMMSPVFDRDAVDITQNIPLGGQTQVAFSFLSANVEVEEGNGPDIVVEMRVAGPEGSLEGYALECQAGASGKVYAEPSIKNTAVEEATIRMPRGIDLALKTLSGDIAVRCRCGKLAINTTSGNIEVDEAQETLNVHSLSGDLEVEGAERCTIQTSSGNIHIERAGVCAIETMSGDIEIEKVDELGVKTASGDVRVESIRERAGISTASGDVEIGCSGDAVEVQTASGEISLSSKTTGPGSIVLQSASGDINLDLENDGELSCRLSSVSGSIDAFGRSASRTLAFDRGGGSLSVKAQTVSGDISVN